MEKLRNTTVLLKMHIKKISKGGVVNWYTLESNWTLSCIIKHSCILKPNHSTPACIPLDSCICAQEYMCGNVKAALFVATTDKKINSCRFCNFI